MAGVDINTLTMEQYLALLRENQASSVVKQKVKGNVNFEIESQFIVSQDAVLLRMFLFTFSGSAKRWVDRLTPGAVNTLRIAELIMTKSSKNSNLREVSEKAKDKNLRDHWRKRFDNEYDDSEEFKDPDGCRETKENEILGTELNKLHNEWFKGTYEVDEDLEGIIDDLEPTLYYC
nr:hypothetical protein [Tanacetum cinerariifolium]